MIANPVRHHKTEVRTDEGGSQDNHHTSRKHKKTQAETFSIATPDT